MTENPLDRAVERAAQPTWQISITAHGAAVQVQWSTNLHPEAVPMILVDQAKRIIEAQFNQRRKDAPSIVVPTMIPKAANGGHDRR